MGVFISLEIPIEFKFVCYMIISYLFNESWVPCEPAQSSWAFICDILLQSGQKGEGVGSAPTRRSGPEAPTRPATPPQFCEEPGRGRKHWASFNRAARV